MRPGGKKGGEKKGPPPTKRWKIGAVEGGEEKFSEASTEPSVVMPKGALRKVPRNVVTGEESTATPMVGTPRIGVKTVVAVGVLRTPERVAKPSGVMATIKTAVTSEEASAPRRKEGGGEERTAPDEKVEGWCCRRR